MRRLTALGLFLLLGCASGSSVIEVAFVESAQPWFGQIERFPYLVAVSDSSATIRWRTIDPSKPAVRFWGDGDTLVVDVPEPQRDHTVLLRELEPDTTYRYQVRIDDQSWTSPIEFETFPSPGETESFTFIAFGDSGTRKTGQLSLAQQLNKEEPDLLIHTGDVAYDNGTDRELTRNHFEVYAPLLARAPFFPSPGNHDIRVSAKPFVDAFSPPREWPSGSPFYYAFTVGNVRFIALDVNDVRQHTRRYGRFTDRNGRQYRWLVAELEAARRDSTIDWIVPYFHHSPYSASTGWSGHGSINYVRDVLAPLADRYDIPVVFSGHDHDYQRSHPIRSGEIAEDGRGTVYIVTGGGGGKWRLRGTGAQWFTAYGEQIHHFVRVRVDGKEMTIEAVDATGRVFDTTTLRADTG